MKPPTYRCEVRSLDALLAQIVRLVSSGHYFYFACTLRGDKDPQKLDEKLIRRWNLDKPAWRRESRRRGRAPNIHYLRYGRFYVLITTHGKTEDGGPHPFFREYRKTLRDIRKHALQCFGYSIRYPVSKESGRRSVFVRLDKDTFRRTRGELLDKATRPRYATRETMEAEFRRLPFQWYKPVQQQLRVIAKQANAARRRAGYPPVRLGCVPQRMRVTTVFAEDGPARRIARHTPTAIRE